MTIWRQIRSRINEKAASGRVSENIYKKVATSGVNMFRIIKPSFFIGEMSSLSYSYMHYVERLLEAEDGDVGEFVRILLYIREVSRDILYNSQNLQSPFADLLVDLEEIFEGEILGTCEEYEDEIEPEEVDLPQKESLDEILNVETEEEISGEEDELTGREDMAADYNDLKEKLYYKIRTADISEKLTFKLSESLANVYLESIQLEREIDRMKTAPDGDLDEIMSILIDLHFGLCSEMKRYIMDETAVEEQFAFEPGLLTLTANFLSDISEKLNRNILPV